MWMEGRTDRHDEANSRLSQFCKHPDRYITYNRLCSCSFLRRVLLVFLKRQNENSHIEWFPSQLTPFNHNTERISGIVLPLDVCWMMYNVVSPILFIINKTKRIIDACISDPAQSGFVNNIDSNRSRICKVLQYSTKQRVRLGFKFVNMRNYHPILAASVVQKQRAGLWYPSSRVQTRAKLSDFSGRKNPQHAFLRKGSKAVCHMSQIYGM